MSDLTPKVGIFGTIAAAVFFYLLLAMKKPPGSATVAFVYIYSGAGDSHPGKRPYSAASRKKIA
ncbi:hypothetical protein SAMN05216204_10758 [Massilia yuzhufengensis]|uniref:Uncharacterized protein n=1 Tax=Massilia yuzhufengensis TaxID=1164594 RepID=A0A1I1K5V0_9BURK|nr:hypothetical protein SAMN05216204_10758 [Massilia yuzhufengensis]